MCDIPGCVDDIDASLDCSTNQPNASRLSHDHTTRRSKIIVLSARVLT